MPHVSSRLHTLARVEGRTLISSYGVRLELPEWVRVRASPDNLEHWFVATSTPGTPQTCKRYGEVVWAGVSWLSVLDDVEFVLEFAANNGMIP